MERTRKELRSLLGSIPEEKDGFRHLMRLHQGWWRMAVLGENPGKRPNRPEEEVCNTIGAGEESGLNFLTRNTRLAVEQELSDRAGERLRYGADAGIVKVDRLYNNLLSSQPLAFNFFGELKLDRSLAAEVMRLWYPEVEEVEKVRFEYAPLPKEKYTDDRSAFDVAFFCRGKGERGLIGLEVKYTDDFSTEGRPKQRYREVFESTRGVFNRPYEAYFCPEYVQLFRNELIAEALRQNGEIDFVRTGLFCHQADERANETGRRFQEMLTEGQRRFKVITFEEYLEKVQRIVLNWKQRKWTMLLWARYCGLELSGAVRGPGEKAVGSG